MKRSRKSTIEVHQTRPPLDRMLRIHQELQAQKFPNAATLSRDLEISGKTAHRDIAFMQERLDLPIEWDNSRNGYHYARPVTNFPTMHFTEGELVALVVAEKALQQYRGSNFEKPLLSAIRKMEESLPETISLSLSDIDQTISFRTSAEQILDLEIFDALAKATAAHKQIEFAYSKP
jgi:predicted DNA-binding transcriptional regulator YafY